MITIYGVEAVGSEGGLRLSVADYVAVTAAKGEAIAARWR